MRVHDFVPPFEGIGLDAPAGRSRSATAVDIGSVLGADDEDDGVFFDQPVDGPVRSAARREVAGQFTAERFSDSARVVAERSDAELPHREGNRQ